jgi:hypothetical protein
MIGGWKGGVERRDWSLVSNPIPPFAREEGLRKPT